MSALTPYLKLDEALTALKGRKGGLRTAKPTGTLQENGLNQCLWSLLAYHTGRKPRVNIAAQSIRDLNVWVDANIGKGAIDFTGFTAEPIQWEARMELRAFVKLLLTEIGSKFYLRKDYHDRLLYYNR